MSERTGGMDDRVREERMNGDCRARMIQAMIYDYEDEC